MEKEPPKYITYASLEEHSRIDARAKCDDKRATVEHEGRQYRFWAYGAHGEPWYELVEGAAIEAARPAARDAYLPAVDLTPDELAEWAAHGAFTRDGRPYVFWQASSSGQPWFKLVAENLSVAADAKPAPIMAAGAADGDELDAGWSVADWWRSLWGAGDES